MRTIIALVCLGLLACIMPVGAQGAPKEYSLTVSVHESLHPRLTAPEVTRLLKGTSDLLNKCNVRFTLKGSVKTFSSAPAIIRDGSASDRDAVYAVDADVKVVHEINFCHPGLPKPFNGCSFPFEMGRNSMIVTHIRAGSDELRSILWAHEFGHRTGLQHRPQPEAIMSGCGLEGFQDDVTDDECRCYFSGPGTCPPAHVINHPVCSNQ